MMTGAFWGTLSDKPNQPDKGLVTAGTTIVNKRLRAQRRDAEILTTKSDRRVVGRALISLMSLKQ
jgi:hypothetical protein